MSDLPPLRPAPVRDWRRAALAGLGLAVLIASWTTLDALAWRQRPFLGVFFYPDGHLSPVQRPAWQVPPALRLPGSRLLRLQRLTATAAFLGPEAAARATWIPGEVVVLEMESPQGEIVRLERHVRPFTATDFAVTFVVPLAVGALFVLMAAVVLLGRPDSVPARCFWGLSTAVGLFYLMTFDASTTGRFLTLWQAYPFFAALSLHLFAVYPVHQLGGRREEEETLVPQPAAPRRPAPRFPEVALLLGYLGAGLVVAARELLYLGQGDRALAVIAFTGVRGYFAGVFLLDSLMLGRALRVAPSPAATERARMLFGLFFITAGAGLVWMFGAASGAAVLSFDRAMLISALFPILMAYGLFVRNVFDLQVVLRPAVTSLVSAPLAIAFYVGVLAALRALGDLWLPPGNAEDFWSPVLAMLLVAASFQRLRGAAEAALDRLLFQSRLGLLRAFRELSAELARLHSLESVADLLGRGLGASLGASFVHLRLAPATSSGGSEGPREFHFARRPDGVWEANGRTSGEARERGQLDPTVTMPLIAGGRLVAELEVGPRAAGYGRTERTLLTSLAPVAALAIDNARLHAEQAHAQRMAALGAVAELVIHEIKNPLGTIRVSVGTLKRRFEPGESGHELATFVEEEVERMDRSLRQLLLFGRPSAPLLEPLSLPPFTCCFAWAARPPARAAAVASPW